MEQETLSSSLRHRAFMISNTPLGRHNRIENISYALKASQGEFSEKGCINFSN